MRFPVLPRQVNNDQSGTKNNTVIICAAVIVFTVTFFVMLYFVLRTLRRMDCRPKYLPGKYLKEKWKQWTPGVSYGQVPGGSAPNRTEDTTYHGEAAAGATGSEMNSNGVRRDTSIRSIITLPAYSPSPKPEERVIAREGERGGMDVVVEYPETTEEEERRREEQMEALYQIRLRRRQELAEREARRRERREARARGDYLRLEQLRQESRARERSQSAGSGSNTNLSAAAALAEHQSRGRDRRISSVSYAELGYVRHDGSRVRASSPDSDHHPLLPNAAALNVDGDRHSLSGPSSLHSRGESFSSSIMSGSTGGSDHDNLTPAASRTQPTVATMPTAEDDLGTHQIPPPDYDHLDWGEAPPYESPVADRGENTLQLPQATPLPTIHIDVASPVSGTSPNTPTNSHQREQESSISTSTDNPAQSSQHSS